MAEASRDPQGGFYNGISIFDIYRTLPEGNPHLHGHGNAQLARAGEGKWLHGGSGRRGWLMTRITGNRLRHLPLHRRMFAVQFRRSSKSSGVSSHSRMPQAASRVARPTLLAAHGRFTFTSTTTTSLPPLRMYHKPAASPILDLQTAEKT